MSLDDTRRDAIARRLCVLICSGSLDELRALDVICGRVFGIGRDNYGATNLATDTRDFRKEAADEIADAVWYWALDVVRRNDERLERLRCEAADEVAERVEPGLREIAQHGLDHLFDMGGEG